MSLNANVIPQKYLQNLIPMLTILDLHFIPFLNHQICYYLKIFMKTLLTLD